MGGLPEETFRGRDKLIGLTEEHTWPAMTKKTI